MPTDKTLRECLYETIHRTHGRSLKLIAEEIGMSQSYLTRAALPDHDEDEGGSGCRFPLNKLVPLIKATNNYSVLDSLEASVGRVAVAMPKGESSLHDVCRLAMQTVKKTKPSSNTGCAILVSTRPKTRPRSPVTKSTRMPTRSCGST